MSQCGYTFANLFTIELQESIEAIISPIPKASKIQIKTKIKRHNNPKAVRPCIKI